MVCLILTIGCIPTIPEILVIFEPLNNHALPSAYYQRSFTVSGLNLWNSTSLSRNIQESTSVSSFRSLLVLNLNFNLMCFLLVLRILMLFNRLSC